jgi:uncharacterized protein
MESKACPVPFTEVNNIHSMTELPSKELIIEETQKWVEDFVIGYNICPFAAKVLNNIHYSIFENTNIDFENYFLQILIVLDENTNIKTSLLIIPNNVDDFYTYLDLVELAESIITSHNYEGTYQVASFHPNYIFENSKEDDPANFTNRSPYPMLHLIREESISEAIETYGDTDQIPKNNIKLMNEIGYDKLKTALKKKEWF